MTGELGGPADVRPARATSSSPTSSRRLLPMGREHRGGRWFRCALGPFAAEQAAPWSPEVFGDPSTEVEVGEPPLFQVIMHNDHYTTMDFVVSVLESVFRKSPSEATQIMLAIHRHGVGRCGIYTREVAEMKIEHVHRLARKHEFPLRCSLQEA